MVGKLLKAKCIVAEEYEALGDCRKWESPHPLENFSPQTPLGTLRKREKFKKVSFTIGLGEGYCSCSQRGTNNCLFHPDPSHLISQRGTKAFIYGEKDN